VVSFHRSELYVGSQYAQIVILRRELSLSSFRASVLLEAWRVIVEYLRSKTGLWNAPRRKEQLALIRTVLGKCWWGMQLLNGPEANLLEDPLTGAGDCYPPMSRTETPVICSAKPESNDVHASCLYIGWYHARMPRRLAR
jgi:hypothetical protein